MAHVVPGRVVGAGGGRGHHGLHLARGEGLGDVGLLHLHGRGAREARELLELRVVGAEAQPREAVHRLHGALRVEPLRRPGHREERPEPLLGQQLRHHGLLRLPEPLRLLVGAGQEGLAVEAEGRVLVGEPAEEELADRHLARAHGVLDGLVRVEAPGRVHRDLQRAVRGIGHLLGETLDVLGVEGRVAVGRGHVPGLGRGGRGGQRRGQGGGERWGRGACGGHGGLLWAGPGRAAARGAMFPRLGARRNARVAGGPPAANRRRASGRPFTVPPPSRPNGEIASHGGPEVVPFRPHCGRVVSGSEWRAARSGNGWPPHPATKKGFSW